MAIVCEFAHVQVQVANRLTFTQRAAIQYLSVYIYIYPSSHSD